MLGAAAFASFAADLCRGSSRVRSWRCVKRKIIRRTSRFTNIDSSAGYFLSPKHSFNHFNSFFSPHKTTDRRGKAPCLNPLAYSPGLTLFGVSSSLPLFPFSSIGFNQEFQHTSNFCTSSSYHTLPFDIILHIPSNHIKRMWYVCASYDYLRNCGSVFQAAKIKT